MAFGHYELIEEIGRGGMGVVWRARDTKVGREVALKVLPIDMTKGANFRSRFEREAQTVASLEHSAIVPIYDVGQVGEQPYIAMRLMPGGSLEERIRRGRMSLDDVIPVMRRIGDALDAAHAAKVVHRDIKPANILFDGYNAAHLTDFGVVKIAADEGVTSLTGEGRTLGTPAYMAPEMAETGAATPQVDVYAMGITLYQMLTGELPYSGTTPVAILMAHINRPIPKVAEARPDLPPAVQDVINAALAKDPRYRIRKASDIAPMLEAARSGDDLAATMIEPTPVYAVESELPRDQPVAPPPPSPRKKEKKRSGVGLVVLALGGLGILTLVGVAVAVIALLVVPNLADGSAPTAVAEAPTAEVIEPTTDSPPVVVEEPTPTFTAVATTEPTVNSDDIEAAAAEAVRAYDEDVIYLLETLDTCCIAETARGDALEARLNAVDVLTAAGSCVWSYSNEDLTILQVNVISNSEAEVIARLARDGTVFCGAEERDQFAFRGPTFRLHRVERFSDGWFVTDTENLEGYP